MLPAAGSELEPMQLLVGDVSIQPTGCRSHLSSKPKQNNVGSKLNVRFSKQVKCPVSLNHPQPLGLWKSWNPVVFAGFPSQAGKSVFRLSRLASFPRPSAR
jgi:hypothetical protein